MPRFLKPNKSTQHRVAAIALYRALLTRCRSAALPNNDRTLLRNAIRNKFRNSRHLSGRYQIGMAFKAGYDTLDCLDTNNIPQVVQLLTLLPSALLRPNVRPTTPKPKPHNTACLPPSRALLNVRPYAETSGPRHVPILATANGVPFLRIKKPQPESLSRVLRQKLARRIANFDRKIELVNWWRPIAVREDEWDGWVERLVLREGKGEGEEARDEVKWVDAVTESTKLVEVTYEKALRRDREIAGKMQRIVDKEMELALKEGRTVIRGRKKRPIWVLEPLDEEEKVGVAEKKPAWAYRKPFGVLKKL